MLEAITMRERTIPSFRDDDGGVAVLEAPPRRSPVSESARADEFAAAARQAIARALSADSETFLQATRQTSGE
jgi:hypothetical protein